MADLTITAANLIPSASASIKHGISGAAVAAGKSVYIDPDTKTIKLADNDAVVAAEHDAVGISLNATAAAGQPISYICPRADVTTGDELVILGVAKSTSVLAVGVRDTNVVL